MLTSTSQPRVLLVVTDEQYSADTVRLLGTVSVVECASNGEAAVDMLRRSDWDLVFIEVELPGAAEFDLIREAKRLNPLAATLILTKGASFDDAVTAMKIGADDLMVKPVEEAELIARVLGLLTGVSGRKAEHKEVVLAVGAHPDDVEIGIGGILLRHAARGDTVVVLTLTGGEKGGERAARALEAKWAAELISARLVHRELLDTIVRDDGLTIEMIKELVDEISPSVVYTHTFKDVHQDHRNVHSATISATRNVPRIYAYQAPSTTVAFEPRKFIGIDDYIDRKLQMIETYASQVEVRAYLKPDLLRSTARYWGRFSEAKYVEPLEVIRESDPGFAPVASSTIPKPLIV